FSDMVRYLWAFAGSQLVMAVNCAILSSISTSVCRNVSGLLLVRSRKISCARHKWGMKIHVLGKIKTHNFSNMCSGESVDVKYDHLGEQERGDVQVGRKRTFNGANKG